MTWVIMIFIELSAQNFEDVIVFGQQLFFCHVLVIHMLHYYFNITLIFQIFDSHFVSKF